MSDDLSAPPAIRIAALAKRYGAAPALRGVSVQVAAAASFGLVGANGAGKTTLIKCVLDLCAYQSGAIDVFGVPARLPAARRRLAYVPERFIPPHYLRCEEFLAAMVQLAGGRYDASSAASVLESLELDPGVLPRPVRSLSKGMTQKLGLAWCFLVERDLYILDEPMSGLDPAARVALKARLQRLDREGRTLFFTSHVLSDVEELCSRIAVLDKGQLLFVGSPAALCSRYAEARLEQAFIRCIHEQSPAHA